LKWDNAGSVEDGGWEIASFKEGSIELEVEKGVEAGVN